MSKPNKIVKLGLEKIVHELRNQGLGYHAISKVLEEQHGVKISFMSIKRYFESVDLAAESPEVRKNIVKDKIDTVQQLKEINRVIWELMNNAIKQGDKTTILRAAKEIREQLELQAKLLGDIQESPTTLVWNVIKVEHAASENH